MSSTTSPNASDSSFEPNNKDHLKNMASGFTTRQDQHDHADFMPMFNSSSSCPSPSMHATVLNSIIDKLPMLEHGLNMPPSGGAFFNTGPCFSQSGVDNNDKGFYFENNGGVFGSVNINGVEGDMYVPPLESVCTISDHNLKVESTCNTDTNNTCYFDDINRIIFNNCNNNTNNINKRGENRVAGVENLFQEELTIGEWDLEELMKDVSSFPFLDFSN